MSYFSIQWDVKFELNHSIHTDNTNEKAANKNDRKLVFN